MQLLVRFGIFLAEWWLVIPAIIAIGGTLLIEYLKKQNEFLKEWDPTLKILTWAVAAALAWGLIPKRDPPASTTPSAATIESANYKWVPPDAEMYIRECPGINCSEVSMMRRGGKVVFLGKRQIYTESNGNKTPWIYIRHVVGERCSKFNHQGQRDCLNWDSNRGETGWVNEQKLWSNAP